MLCHTDKYTVTPKEIDFWLELLLFYFTCGLEYVYCKVSAIAVWEKTDQSGDVKSKFLCMDKVEDIGGLFPTCTSVWAG